MTSTMTTTTTTSISTYTTTATATAAATAAKTRLGTKEPHKRELPPFPKVLEPLPYRVVYFVQIWLIKILGSLFLWYHINFNPQEPSTRPDEVKRYSCRPKLPVHLFFPETYRQQLQQQPTKSASSSDEKPSPTLLPLYIDIHGGGFALGSATLDNTFSRTWSDRSTMIVASLNYSKTPVHPYPTAPNDIAMVADAVINDPDLPVDKSRVVIGGFSAGGLLCLSATQLAPLKGQCHAAVAYYPCVDFSEHPMTKFATRLDREKAWESLNSIGGALDWGYTCAGQDRRDPILSPCYAQPDDLPKNICVVGAQYDMFCREGRDIIFDLAGRDPGEENVKAGEGWKCDFEDGRYKWIYAQGMAHGFTEVVGVKKRKGITRKGEYCERMYHDVHTWLAKTVL